MRALARSVVGPYTDSGPPFDPALLAQDRGVLEIRLESLNAGRDAMLIPVPGGFVVKIDQNANDLRKRFGLAHEVGHTFFFSTQRHMPFRPYQRFHRDQQEERLCDIFAEEVLMPEVTLTEDLGLIREPSVSSFVSLARRYRVSSQCAAICVAGKGKWNVAIVGWRYRSLKTKEGNEKAEKLRVVWSAAPRGWFVPKGDSVAGDSMLQRCYETGDRASGDEKLGLGSIRGVHRVDCVSTSGAPGQDILSLIYL